MNFYQQYNPYQQQLLQMQMQAQQTGGNFIHVPSEEVARNYSVAPGASVTFIDDNAPYCYTKTAGMSQLDIPVFRKFRLVEEKPTEATERPSAGQQADPSSDIPDIIKQQIGALTARIEALESRVKENDYEPTERTTKTKRNADAPASKG